MITYFQKQLWLWAYPSNSHQQCQFRFGYYHVSCHYRNCQIRKEPTVEIPNHGLLMTEQIVNPYYSTNEDNDMFNFFRFNPFRNNNPFDALRFRKTWKAPLLKPPHLSWGFGPRRFTSGLFDCNHTDCSLRFRASVGAMGCFSSALSSLVLPTASPPLVGPGIASHLTSLKANKPNPRRALLKSTFFTHMTDTSHLLVCYFQARIYQEDHHGKWLGLVFANSSKTNRIKTPNFASLSHRSEMFWRGNLTKRNDMQIAI